MTNDEDLAKLRQGVDVWNERRLYNRESHVNLKGANLRGYDLRDFNLELADLQGADLREADLSKAKLYRAKLREAKLQEADLRGADLHGADLEEARLCEAKLCEANLFRAKLPGACLVSADLSKADLSGADLGGNADLSKAHLQEANLQGANLHKARLSKADLRRAYLHWADLSQADLRGADLRYAVLVQTELTDADLTGCRIHGISAWDLRVDGAKQRDLVITTDDQPKITVDYIEVGQFIYLLLHNEKIRDVIDTITSKVVLIIGRFTSERKAVLDALRDELRTHDYLPVLFDFDKPRTRTTLETVSTLAHMARFVVADITDAKSVLQELQAIVPNNPSVPVQPLLLTAQAEPGMFDFLRSFPCMLETYYYPAIEDLLAELGAKVIAPAEAKVLRSG